MADNTALPGTGDASGAPKPAANDGGLAKDSWLDLSDAAIPVIDPQGKKVVLKGAGFVSPAAPAATSAAPTPAPSTESETKMAPPPANLPTLDETPKAAPAPVGPQPATSLGDLGLDDASDAADIKKIEEKSVAKTVDAAVKKELPLLESMVQDAVSGTGVTLSGDDMRRRYSLLISLYFRDLRDSLETKSKFTMPQQSGGMGFDDATADRVMADLGARNAKYKEQLTGKAADDKSQYVAKRTEAILNIQENIDRADQEKGDKAFEGLMQRVGVRGEEQPAPPVAEPKSIPVVGLDSKPPAASAASAIPVSGQPTAPRMSQVVDAGSRASGNRPMVADVAYAPKLTGPVEELRQLTLKDFRRLSRDPKEATLKIKDKIDLLEDQSFEVKTAGINAWHECEVNRMYLEILRQSLEGKPMVEVIADMEKNAVPTLTKDEFDAVMQLNQKLRFG